MRPSLMDRADRRPIASPSALMQQFAPSSPSPVPQRGSPVAGIDHEKVTKPDKCHVAMQVQPSQGSYYADGDEVLA